MRSFLSHFSMSCVRPPCYSLAILQLGKKAHAQRDTLLHFKRVSVPQRARERVPECFHACVEPVSCERAFLLNSFLPVSVPVRASPAPPVRVNLLFLYRAFSDLFGGHRFPFGVT